MDQYGITEVDVTPYLGSDGRDITVWTTIGI